MKNVSDLATPFSKQFLKKTILQILILIFPWRCSLHNAMVSTQSGEVQKWLNVQLEWRMGLWITLWRSNDHPRRFCRGWFGLKPTSQSDWPIDREVPGQDNRQFHGLLWLHSAPSNSHCEAALNFQWQINCQNIFWRTMQVHVSQKCWRMEVQISWRGKQ